jgi:hypothetical protein
MTLSELMRDIVFFPLAAFLMRRATWLSRYQSSAVATMTVFVLFGVWHSGASLGWRYGKIMTRLLMGSPQRRGDRSAHA